MSGENDAKHYSLNKLCSGVYAAIAADGGSAIGNAGLVDLGGAALVIDTFLTPSAAEYLRADAQRLMSSPLRWVVNTHYHNDHIWGNQVFSSEAEIISTAKTRELIQTAGKAEFDQYRAISAVQLQNLLAGQAAAETEQQRAAFAPFIGYFTGLVADFPRLRVTLPNLVFEQRLTLYGSRRRAELLAFADAHTGSDLVVFLPDDGVLFMSDLLFVNFHPYLGDGSPRGWVEALNSILRGAEGLNSASRFVPGHGPVGTLADVERLTQYITDCQQAARELIDQAKTTPEAISALPVPAAYARWDMPRFFYENLQFLIASESQRDEGTE